MKDVSWVTGLWWWWLLVEGTWGSVLKQYVLLPYGLPSAQQTNFSGAKASLVLCAHACDTQTGCQAFIWQERQSVECVLLSQLPGYKNTPTTGLHTYITTNVGGVRLIYLPNVLTWKNATAQCAKSPGGTLLKPPLVVETIKHISSFAMVVFLDGFVGTDSILRDSSNNQIDLSGKWASNQPSGASGRSGEVLALTNIGYYTQPPLTQSSDTAALCILP
nr:uncharacterized protein LOC123756737 [Procambarus clarkii]XP_045595977.1 uncharacterized protein LOC123756737 [Procambarus clarkii]